MSAKEYNFDSLVGPTHNYAGLGHGNLASQKHRDQTSHPKAAALEGLEKMKLLHDMGVPQAIIPPHERPHIAALKSLGFTGSDSAILAKAAKEAPPLLAACSSASAMWAANAATISPSADTLDGKLHITPANLTFQLHRSLEAPFTAKLLRTLFPGELFVHHDPLPPALTDEGAANHSRLSKNQNDPGIELFTFGKSSARFTPRQSPRASKAIARLHKLPPQKTFFLEQFPRAIDAGVFHNDVIAVAHRHIFLYHELAYENFPLAALQRKFRRLLPIRIPQNLLPLNDAVRSYLFNSQLVTLPDDTFALILPTECREINSAARTIDFIREKAPIISTAAFINVRQSMNNGGGPACLRLRVVLTPREEKAVHAGILFTDTLYKKLRTWIETHYRETLRPADLADPRLLRESRTALDELTRILKLPPLYPFQQ